MQIGMEKSLTRLRNRRSASLENCLLTCGVKILNLIDIRSFDFFLGIRRVDDINKLLVSIRPFFSNIPKAKTAKIGMVVCMSSDSIV